MNIQDALFLSRKHSRQFHRRDNPNFFCYLDDALISLTAEDMMANDWEFIEGVPFETTSMLNSKYATFSPVDPGWRRAFVEAENQLKIKVGTFEMDLDPIQCYGNVMIDGKPFYTRSIYIHCACDSAALIIADFRPAQDEKAKFVKAIKEACADVPTIKEEKEVR